MHMGHLCSIDNMNFQMLGSQEGAHKEGSIENHPSGSEDWWLALILIGCVIFSEVLNLSASHFSV